MKKRRLARKSLKQLKKLVQKRRYKFQLSKKKKIIIQLIAFIILGFFVSLGVSDIAPFLEDYVPENNENWAVALIAIPIALFGVWLSIYFPCLKKYDCIFTHKDLNRTYNQSIHFFDFESFFKIRLLFDFLLWVVSYFMSDYAKMVAYSFVMVGDLLYLICFTIWKYKQNPTKLYHDNIMRSYSKAMIGDSVKLAEQVKPLLDKDEFGEAGKKIETIYSDFWEEVDYLTLSILSDKNRTYEKDTFLSIFTALNKLPFQETNGLIMHRFVNRAIIVFEHSLNTNDYLYAKQLADQIFIVWFKYIDKTCKYLGDFFKYAEASHEGHTYLYIKELEELVNIINEVKYRFDLMFKVFCLHSDNVVKIIEDSKTNEILNLYFCNTESKETLLQLCVKRKEDLEYINNSFKKLSIKGANQ